MLEPKPLLCHPLSRTLQLKPQRCLFCLQTRPTPPHLTSAMAENILAAACESETRKAAKRMRLEIYQSSQVCAHAGYLEGSHPQGEPLVIHTRLQLGWTGRWEGGQPSCSLQVQHCGEQKGCREEGAKRC